MMKSLHPFLIMGCVLALHVPTASAQIIDHMFPSSTADQPSTVQTATSSVPSNALRSASFNVTESGTLRTDSGRTITRGEFTTMIAEALYSPQEMNNCFWEISSVQPPAYTLLFTDVPVDQPDSGAICVAMRDGLIQGYKDGSFHPEDPITFAEASKILSRAFVLAPYAEYNKTGLWFRPYAEALSVRNAIPSTIKSFDQKITAGEADDMLVRIAYGQTWKPASSIDDLLQAWTVANAPKPIVRRVNTIQHIQARTPLGAGMSPTGHSSSSSAVSSDGSSSQSPWYKIF